VLVFSVAVDLWFNVDLRAAYRFQNRHVLQHCVGSLTKQVNVVAMVAIHSRHRFYSKVSPSTMTVASCYECVDSSRLIVNAVAL